MSASFGLDAAVLPAPYSAIVSILLLAGVFAVGRVSGVLSGIGRNRDSSWEAATDSVVGAAWLAVILYPLILFRVVGPVGLRYAGVALTALGMGWILGRAPRACSALRSAWRGPIVSALRVDALPYWIVCGLGLLALGPTTNADSLNYHAGVALKFLQEGVWPVDPEWFHSRLAGSGEALIALGLAVGAEQFGSLLQWTGVLTLVGLLLRYPGRSRPLLTLLTLALVSSPVLLFLISSDKPQLLPIAMTSTALAFATYPSRRGIDRRSALTDFGLVCLLVMAASQMKLNFLVSGSLVGLVAFGLAARRGLSLPAFLIAAAAFGCIVVPGALWKHQQFGGPVVASFLTPFPGEWPGYDAFVKYLRDYRDSPLAFPLSLVMPAGIGLISTVIGVGVFAFVWLRPGRDAYCWLVVAVAIGVTLFGTLFGQSSARFYFEPFMWVLMAIAMQPVTTHGGLRRPLVLVLALQVVLCSALIAYSTVRSLPGALTPAWRTRLMEQQADGYTLMKWVGTVLPDNAVLASFHASIALAPRKAFASDWTVFTGHRAQDWLPYLDRLMHGGVTHALVFGDPSASPLAGCFSGAEAGPFSSTKATRNPMNAGKPYSAWLMKIDRSRLPSCFKK